MVTGCAILLGGLLSRYAAINDRLRLLAHERLDLLRIANSDPGMTQTLLAERLEEIDRQVPDLLSRHKQERDAVLSAYCAAIAFIVTMFVIALAALVESDIVATVALGLFLFGTAVLA